jgi:dephospho-CoA kinase
MIREMGITIVDADIEARLAVKQGEPAYDQILKEFGSNLLMSDGEIDRQKLGSIIFHDEQKRLRLNQIVHPEVRNRMNRKKEESIKKGEKAVILDIPLLFESQLTYLVDKIILVYVEREVQLHRLMERNNLTLEEAEARVNSQMPLHEKIILADKWIDNNGNLVQTKKQLTGIFNEWGLI